MVTKAHADNILHSYTCALFSLLAGGCSACSTKQYTLSFGACCVLGFKFYYCILIMLLYYSFAVVCACSGFGFGFFFLPSNSSTEGAENISVMLWPVGRNAWCVLPSTWLLWKKQSESLRAECLRCPSQINITSFWRDPCSPLQETAVKQDLQHGFGSANPIS